MIKAKLKKEPRFLTSIQMENHLQILDEPISLGGNNQGPTPIQSVYAALAGCICMTLRMYAEGKKIPLEDVDVEIDAGKQNVDKKDKRFQEHPYMVDKGKVRFIHAKISVYGKLSEEHVKKLDVIAGKCPVHKMLSKTSWITHETSHVTT
ncbi:OsmC family protein [Balneolaceae bacterium ANBcel3]|nr:OsmC family protein [Balneolaceae bacterium ANBcel3]